MSENSEDITNGAEGSGQPKLYDISMIASISKNSAPFIEKMVVMFVDIVTKDMEALNAAADSGNWHEVGQLAHKLKSTFGNLGVTAMVPYAVALEAGRSDEPMQIVKKLDEGLAAVFVQIKADYPTLF